MKKYSLKINAKSRKYFLKLPEQIQEVILEKLDLLEKGLFKDVDIKEIQPKNLGKFRLRVGKYRIIFEKNEIILLIKIIKIGSRGDIYK